MTSEHSYIIFGAKIENGGTRRVEKNPRYIFSTFGSKINKFEQKKLEKMKKFQIPMHLVNSSCA